MIGSDDDGTENLRKSGGRSIRDLVQSGIYTAQLELEMSSDRGSSRTKAGGGSGRASWLNGVELAIFVLRVAYCMEL